MCGSVCGLNHGHLCLVQLPVLSAVNPRPWALPLWTLVFHKVLLFNSWPLGAPTWADPVGPSFRDQPCREILRSQRPCSGEESERPIACPESQSMLDCTLEAPCFSLWVLTPLEKGGHNERISPALFSRAVMCRRMLGLFFLGLARGSGVGTMGLDFLRPGLWSSLSTVQMMAETPGPSPGSLLLPAVPLARPLALARSFPCSPHLWCRLACPGPCLNPGPHVKRVQT